jgi:hypothetical protein
MNVAQKREGFVDERSEKPKTIDAVAEEKSEKPRSMPAPEIESSPAELPPMWQDEWPLVVKLINKPIRNTQGQLIHELKLREPRAGDINRFGNPVRINQEGDVVWDERKMTYMIAALADILVPFIEDMHPRDWNTVAMKLRNFFLPDPRAW